MVSGGYVRNLKSWYALSTSGWLNYRIDRKCIRSGGIVSGASPAYNIEEMTYALSKAGAKFLITVPAAMDVAGPAAKNAGIPKHRIFLLEGNIEGFTTVKSLLNIGKSFGEDGQIPSFKIPKGKKNRDICAFLSFSSGTTGLPKAVMIVCHLAVLLYMILGLTHVIDRLIRT